MTQQRAKREKSFLNFMKKNDKDILKKFNDLEKETRGVIKLMLLGAGESGKSTVLKQMQIIHGGGFDLETRKSYREKIWFNIYEGAAAIVQAAQDLKITINDKTANLAAQKVVEEYERITSEMINNRPTMTKDLVELIKLLWADEDFKATWERRSEYQLQEVWNEYATLLNDYPKWGGEQWVPDQKDILRCRVRTSGIVDQTFSVTDKVRGKKITNTFNIIDVGGQRAERRKWLALFDGVMGVIFVAAMSGYNQTVFEDETTNRLQESVELWTKTINRKEFERSALILFLNKYDVFHRKYYKEKTPIEWEDTPLSRMTKVKKPPTWDKEEDEECGQVKAWFEALYQYQIKDETRRGSLFTHVTTALDPMNMRKVIGACTVRILEENMERSGLVPQP